jgi:mannose-6-phosphate isomerase
LKGKLYFYLGQCKCKRRRCIFSRNRTVHAIGGLLVAEIQQTSDITYRLYDFDRVDAQGNTREHVDLALEAINYKRVDTRIEYLKEEMSQIQL